MMQNLSVLIFVFISFQHAIKTIHAFQLNPSQNVVVRVAVYRAITSRLFSSSMSGKPEHDYADEETLLCIRLNVQEQTTIDEALSRVSKFCQSFPFSAVLPVQPLMYLPTKDKENEHGGVELTFLRKKTDIKSGFEGGIRFFVKPIAVDDSNDQMRGIEVTAKRNSEGQIISKILAEKLVVTSFMNSITGAEDKKFGDSISDVVNIQSVFHKWM